MYFKRFLIYVIVIEIVKCLNFVYFEKGYVILSNDFFMVLF